MGKTTYEYCTLTAVITKLSYKRGAGFKKVPTVKLKYVSDVKGKTIVKEMWMNFPKDLTMANFKPGEKIAFHAYIVRDEKGKILRLARANNVQKVLTKKQKREIRFPRIAGVLAPGQSLQDFVENQ